MDEGSAVLGLFCGSILFNLVVGAIIGHYKGRIGLGIALAILLGPIGWCILLAMKSVRPICPVCHKPLPDHTVKRCWRCGSDVVLAEPAKSAWERPIGEVMAEWRQGQKKNPLR